MLEYQVQIHYQILFKFIVILVNLRVQAVCTDIFISCLSTHFTQFIANMFKVCWRQYCTWTNCDWFCTFQDNFCNSSGNPCMECQDDLQRIQLRIEGSLIHRPFVNIFSVKLFLYHVQCHITYNFRGMALL